MQSAGKSTAWKNQQQPAQYYKRAIFLINVCSNL
jgi:hypothetical protein